MLHNWSDLAAAAAGTREPIEKNDENHFLSLICAYTITETHMYLIRKCLRNIYIHSYVYTFTWELIVQSFILLGWKFSIESFNRSHWN